MKLWPSRVIVIAGVRTREVDESAIEFLQRPENLASSVKPGSAGSMVSTAPFEKPADGQRAHCTDNDANHPYKRIHKNLNLRADLNHRHADTWVHTWMTCPTGCAAELRALHLQGPRVNALGLA